MNRNDSLSDCCRLVLQMVHYCAIRLPSHMDITLSHMRCHENTEECAETTGSPVHKQTGHNPHVEDKDKMYPQSITAHYARKLDGHEVMALHKIVSKYTG